MKTTDPLILRCMALTGSFETGKLGAASFSALAGDFDGMGISFSCLQWNIGQGTLQPLMRQMLNEHMPVMTRCFGTLETEIASAMAIQPTPMQLSWARSIQGPMNHVVNPEWATAFVLLGATPEWQAVAQVSAAGYFDHARFQASQFKLTSDRAIALLFDCGIQDGGVPSLQVHHVLDSAQPEWGEAEYMRAIAGAVADSCNPRFRQDVLTRKMTIANGIGIVHGLRYDLEKDFAL